MQCNFLIAMQKFSALCAPIIEIAKNNKSSVNDIIISLAYKKRHSDVLII